MKKKRHQFHKFSKIMQFTRFCRDFDLVAKYAFSQAPSCTNFQAPRWILGPGPPPRGKKNVEAEPGIF